MTGASVTIPAHRLTEIAAMRTISLEDFKLEIKAQGVPIEHVALRCPMCGCLQTATDLINAGAGQNLDEVEKYLGFSCVGRFLKAEQPRKKPDGKPCNWTLGGLFKTHKLEVVTPDGERHPRFEIGSPEEAKRLMESRTPPTEKADV